MDEEDKKEKSGFWGSTLSKLKTALKRTRHEVVDEVLERESVDESLESDQNAGADSHSSASVSEVSQNSSGSKENVSTLSPPQSHNQSSSARAKAPPRPIDSEYLEELEEEIDQEPISV